MRVKCPHLEEVVTKALSQFCPITDRRLVTMDTDESIDENSSFIDLPVVTVSF